MTANVRSFLLFNCFYNFFLLISGTKFNTSNNHVLGSRMMGPVDYSKLVDDNIHLLRDYFSKYCNPVKLGDQIFEQGKITNGELYLLHEIQRTETSAMIYDDRKICTLLYFGWYHLDIYYDYEIKMGMTFTGRLKVYVPNIGFYIEMCVDLKNYKVTLEDFKIYMIGYIYVYDMGLITIFVENHVNNQKAVLIDKAEKAIKSMINDKLDKLNQSIQKRMSQPKFVDVFDKTNSTDLNSLKLFAMKKKYQYFIDLIKEVEQSMVLSNGVA